MLVVLYYAMLNFVTITTEVNLNFIRCSIIVPLYHIKLSFISILFRIAWKNRFKKDLSLMSIKFFLWIFMVNVFINE